MNYKLVYIAFISSHFGGVEQKILSQFDALIEIKSNTFLLLVSSSSPEEKLKNEINKRSNLFTIINTPGKTWNPWIRRKEKFELLTDKLKSFDPKETIVYFRFPGADILFLKFLIKNKDYKFITEHQEIENKLRIGILKGNLLNDFNDFTSGIRTRKKIAGFVGVSDQVLETQLSYLNSKIKNKKHFTVIGNGINPLKFKLRNFKEFDGKTLNLLFIGSVFKSHGLHRLLNSLNNYYKSKYTINVKIHVIGVSADSTYLAKFIKTSKMRESVIFHGFLSPTEINKYADECHLAINSLCFHRIGLKVTSTLKSREYFARGIPFITSSSDNDFDENNPYVFKIKSEEKPFDLNILISFAQRLNNDPYHPQKMRLYSINYLDWSVKMKNLIGFLDYIMFKTN